MTDKELIRRALMGDKQAQQACTDKGIALTCPYCGSDTLYVDAPYHSDDIPAEMINDIDCDYDGFCVSCSCGNYIEVEHGTFKDTLAKWNTRPAPPVGKCCECKAKEKAVVNDKGFLICPVSGMEITDNDFCSYFQPKE